MGAVPPAVRHPRVAGPPRRHVVDGGGGPLLLPAGGVLDVTLTQAAHHVVPVAVTAAEQVERLRSWASGRCLSASSPGVYRRDGETAPKAGRRVQRGGTNN